MTVSRENLLKIFVLNELADDFENLEMVAGECGILAAKCGIRIVDKDVIETIAALIKDGSLRAMWLSRADDPRPIEGVPANEDFYRVYFAHTDAGVRRHSENPWPLDDYGNAVPDLTITSRKS